jgi:dihydroxyacid dehydratase/phosphogluconate dehydratase
MTTGPKNNGKGLRSARWFAQDDLRSFGHRSRVLQMGYDYADFMGKPVVGILNTWSDLNQCHSHFRQRVEDVKRGVLQAGGFPVELPSSRQPCCIGICWPWKRRNRSAAIRSTASC